MRRSDPSLRWWIVAVALVLVVAVDDDVPAQQIVPGANVNMVSGTTLPDGDPYLQRQNEPSSAVSTSNPLHILAGVNDYRTVDIPHPSDLLRPQRMNSDAWVGIFKSLDGGQNWKSTLLPGYPQDPAHTAPLWGYDAATDPFMRAGTNGMFYFAGVAFDRGDNAPSAIFVARYKDMNNLEAGDPIVHLDTRIADSDPGGRFLDKVALATDIPRTAASCSFNVPLGDAAGTVVPQTIPSGNVYVAYAAFTGSGATEQSALMFTRSTDCGATWGAPRNLSAGSRLVQNPQIAVSPNNGAIYVSWRRFRSGTQDDSMFVVRSADGGATFGKPVRVAGLRPFDQPTTLTSFRTNGFQTTAVDATGRVYMAWSDRGYATQRPDPLVGDARVVLSTSTNGSTWTVPRPIDTTALGHQVMPALTFHAGKLRLLYYDLREDVSSIFAPFVDDLDVVTANSTVRHTLDVFVAQALPGPTPVFTTARLSDYAFGFIPGADDPQRLQFNPPNLPLFRQGTTPFMGDYIDLAPAPAYLQNPDGSWSHNTAASNAISHAFWTDNRDVRPPADNDWANYTAVGTVSGQPSRYDPSQTLPGCSVGQAGMRNQNVYTARVTEGLFVSAPGNNKPFDDFQRAFVVVAENATSLIRTFRLTIENQPVGGQASFLQFSPLPTLDVTIPPFSSMARTVFATSTDENARINVSIIEVTAPGGVPVAGGLSGNVVLNPDPQAPRLQNPRLQNPRLQNPLISEGEAYNAGITNAVFAVPRLQNPRLQNPTIENPRLQNDSLGNPRLQNDAVANPGVVSVNPTNTTVEAPRLQNPRLQNPRLQNESLVNAAFADTSWSLTNDGNTTAAYTVNLVLNGAIPAGFASQLLIHKTTTTPAANGCDLVEQLQTVLVANIPDPEFVPISDVANPRLQNPRLQNPTLALAPGESATLTLRIVDPNRFDGVTYDASGAVTPAAVAQSVNSEDVAAGSTTPPVAIPLTIATTSLTPAAPGAAYTLSLQTVAGAGALTCSVISGTLPPGLSLSPGGTIAGTPTTPGNYRFTVRCVDANGNEDDQPLFLQIDPNTPTGFDAVWNGLDTDWSNPDNWSPRGVPDPTDRVYISAAIPTIATLTRDVTVRDLFVEPGATVNTNGFNLTITGNADAGRTIIGTGTTILTGDGVSATGVFSHLDIRGRVMLSGPVTTTGRLTVGAGARLSLNGQSLIVGGQLTSNVTTGAVPVISGPASTFIVSGLAVNGLVIQAAPLTVNGGTLAQFDNVSLAGFAPEATQLTINHPGSPASFTLLGISFSTNPTTGRLILANDTLADGNTLVLDVMGAVPADGTADTQTLGGAIVNWVFNPGEANLSVNQSVSPVPAVAGTPLTYTIRVTNGGPAAATGVTLNPGVPAGATGVIATATQGTCAVVAGAWSCALGTLPAGGEAVATVTFVPAGAGVLVTTASVTAAQADSVPANNSHVLAATIVPAGAGVNLSIAKTDSLESVSAGGSFNYSIVVTNAGTTVATGVHVIDPIPTGITILTPTSTQGTCSIAAGQVQCSVGTLNPGQIVTITLPTTAGAPGLVTNTAFVTSNEVDLTPLNNLASQQTMIVATEPLISSTDPVAAELGGDTATLLLSRPSGDPATAPLDLQVSISGTAVNGVDYVLSSPALIDNGTVFFAVRIPAGQASVEVTLTAPPDELSEGVETATFTLGAVEPVTVVIVDTPALRTWVTDADGFWDVPANWSGGVVPQPGDTVVIDRPVAITVTLRTPTTIASLVSQERLTITGGTLSSNGAMVLNGGLTMGSGQITGDGSVLLGSTSFWTGGQMTGIGALGVNIGATLTVDAPAATGVLGRNVVNFGTVIWNQAALTLSGLSIVNNVGAVFEIQNNLPISNGTFTNLGRLFKSGPTGPVTLTGVSFATAGALDLRLTSPTAFDAIQSDGHMSLAGALNLLPQGGYVPGVGTTFNVLTYDSQDGAFETIVGNGRVYVPTYGVSALTLTTAADASGQPIASAGADQSVTAGITVQLSGAGSSDPDDDLLTYAWSFVSRPVGSAATLSNPAIVAPTFVADVPGTFIVQLVVNDGAQNSAPDLVEIHTNGPPIANAGLDQNVPVGSPVQLNGAGSTDPEGSPLTYLWILNTRPAGSSAVLSNTTIVNPTFVADLPGTYIAQLVVNDGLVNSASDTVTITTQNLVAVANAGPDQSNIAINGTVALDGSASNDPDGGVLTYAWTIVLRPSGSTSVLLNPNTAAPTFVADRAGRYRIQLIVSDALASSPPDTVDVTTVNQPPTADAGPDQTVSEGTLAILNGSGSTDPDLNPLTFAWSFVSVPPGSTAQLLNSTTASPRFTPDLPGVYTVRLVVNDSVVDSAPDTVVITALSSAITMVLVDTPLVGVGRQATLRVILPFAAPSGGVTVTINSDNVEVLTVTPGTVAILEGQTTAQVQVNGIQTGAATLTATAPGYATGEFEVMVTQNILSVPANLNVGLGATASFPVTIPNAAPAGGLGVDLAGSNPAAVELITPTVTIPQGAFGANGSVRGLAVGTSTVTASRTGFASASSQVTTAAALNIIQASAQIRPAFPATITVRLESDGSPVAAPAPGLPVTFVAGNPACVATNGPVTIPTGLISADVTVTYGGSATLPCTTTLTAQSAGVTPESINVTVNPSPGIQLFGFPTNVGSGLQYGTFTARLGETQSGAVTMRIQSSNPALLRVGHLVGDAGAEFIDVTLTNGATDVNFYVHGMEGVTGAATLTATAPGFTAATPATVNVLAPWIELVSVPDTTTTLSADTPFYVRTGVVLTGGTSFWAFQAVRAGGPGLPVNVTHSNGAIADLVTTAGAADSRTVTLAPGAFNTPTTVASGGVAFHPVSAGSTTVSASASGFTLIRTEAVNVTAPGIQLFGFPTNVGSGLQYGTFTARLGATLHGGVTMRIQSSNPALLRVGHAVGDAGAEFIDVTVPNGSTDVNFYVHGMEGVTGAPTITATAPGFTAATPATVNVLAPWIELVSVPDTTTTLSADTPFYVRTGVVLTGGTSFWAFQAVRAGGPGLPVNVTHSNGAIADLVTTAGAADSRTVTLAPGAFNTPTTVASGGVAFHPVSAGSTTVSASASGFTLIRTEAVNVTAPGIQLFGFPTNVGSGLQYGTFTARLGATLHGGVTMRIQSSNPALLRVGHAVGDAGAEFIDVTVPNGSTDVNFYVHGMEGVTGAPTITATAPGFTAATPATVNVLAPWIELVSVPDTTTTLSADTPFYVRTGVVLTGGTSFWAFQAVRVGGPGLTVNVTHNTGAVADLVTTAGAADSRTVTLAPGAFNSPTTVATGGIAFNPVSGGTTTVSASAAGFTLIRTELVTVTAPGIQLFGFPTNVGSGLRYGTFTARLGATQHGGVTMRIQSSNPAVVKFSPNSTATGTDFIDVFVPNGSTDVNFYVDGMEGIVGGVTLTATAPGFTDDTGTINVFRPVIELVGLPDTTTSLSPNISFYVRTGVVLPGGTSIWANQQARPGGPGLTVTVTHTNPAVAQLVTTAGAAQTRTVSVAAGAFNSPTSVAAGGVAFDPVNPGTTIVSASSPGFDLVRTESVTVTAPGITLFSLPTTVGSGLQTGPFTARLEGSAHSGVTMRIQSSNPAVLRVSANATTAGTEFIDVGVPANSTDVTYYIHGIEGSTGSATITATATGFTSETGTGNVVTPGLQIEGLLTSVSATATSDPFLVRVGVPNQFGTSLTVVQNVRFGLTLTATVTNSNANAAQLVTQAGGAQSRSVSIVGGTSASAGTVAAGGIAFDPLAAGATTVEATIPGFTRTDAGLVGVQVQGEEEAPE